VGDRIARRPPEAVAPSARLSPTQPWAALAAGALVLNFAWEMLQAPLYESMRGLPFWTATWNCTKASAGDVVIALVAYGCVAVLAGSRAWLLRPRATHVAGYLAVGLVLTVILEFVNVYVLGRWAYGPRMPRVLGVGLAPLAQWLVVPFAVLGLARRYVRRTHSP
jgi:hypothetical protein